MISKRAAFARWAVGLILLGWFFAFEWAFGAQWTESLLGSSSKVFGFTEFAFAIMIQFFLAGAIVWGITRGIK